MQAGVITAPRTCELRDCPLPQPGPGEVRVRMEGCGICASNIPVWEGRPWFDYPLEPGAPGHEGWGVVDATGPGVPGVAPGDRVGLLSYHALAEYDLAPWQSLVPIPPELDGKPFPAEPLACALNVLRRSDVREGDFVAVVGIGFLGALLVQLARSRGARVAAVSRRQEALDIARTFGAELCLRPDDPEDVVRRVQQWSGEGCQRAMEVTGKSAPLELASKLLRVRGKLIVAGYHQDGPRQVDMQQWNWLGLDVINAHERDPAIYVEGMRLALDEIAAGRLTPEPLYTHRFALSELADALETARNRPPGFMKALVEMDRPVRN